MHKFQNRNAKVENTTYVVRAHITICFSSFILVHFHVIWDSSVDNSKSPEELLNLPPFFLPQLFAILVAKMEGVAWPLSNVNAPREWLELFAKNVSIFSCVGICQSWFLSTFKEFSRTTLVPGSSDKKRAFHFPLQTIRLLTKSLWWIG